MKGMVIKMLKIGDFAKFTKISIHMLRHYDEIGLLTPMNIDESSGYRYYSEEQIPYANKIQLLKSMGFGLPNIKLILENYMDENHLKKYIEMQLASKEDEMKQLNIQIQLLKGTLTDLELKKNPLEYSLFVKEIPKRLVVSYRGLISAFNQEGILWQALAEESSTMHIKYATPAFDVAIIHNSDSLDVIDVEVQKSVDKIYTSKGNIQFKEIPSSLVAVVAYQGGYEHLEHINQEIATWITKNDYELNGEIMNVYHISPKNTQNNNEFLTEVCFPIE